MLVRTLEYGQHISSIIINEGVIVRKGNTYTMPVDGIVLVDLLMFPISLKLRLFLRLRLKSAMVLAVVSSIISWLLPMEME